MPIIILFSNLNEIIINHPILVSGSSFYFTLAVSMCEISCVGYAFYVWDPRSLQYILDGPVYLNAY